MIKANDTDVLVIAVRMLMHCELGIEKLWISFGQGDNHRWIPVHDVYQKWAWKNQKAFSSFRHLQAVMSCRHFVAKGK